MNIRPSAEQRQADQYKMAFSIFRANAAGTPGSPRANAAGTRSITGVTFWNMSDRSTWLDGYPVPGRKNYPLLFDTDGQPKKA